MAEVTALEVSEEMLTAAMRAFEPLSSILRYREKDKWHACDLMAMREAIKAVAPMIVEQQARRGVKLHGRRGAVGKSPDPK